MFKISAIGKARISAYSFKTQLGRLAGPPEREVLTALSFLATVASVKDKGSSSSEATRILSTEIYTSTGRPMVAGVAVVARNTETYTRTLRPMVAGVAVDSTILTLSNANNGS